MREYRTILVPFDFSAHARAALAEATNLAQRLGAGLCLIHVVQPPTYAYGYGASPDPSAFDLNEIHGRAARMLDEIADSIPNAPGPVDRQVLEDGSIANAIQQAAREHGADMIVMGTHGRTGLAHVFLGSVAERTLRNAPCPVLTVQAPEEDD